MTHWMLADTLGSHSLHSMAQCMQTENGGSASLSHWTVMMDSDLELGHSPRRCRTIITRVDLPSETKTPQAHKFSPNCTSQNEKCVSFSPCGVKPLPFRVTETC
eukprot:3937851-Rhodomonas_salina.5